LFFFRARKGKQRNTIHNLHKTYPYWEAAKSAADDAVAGKPPGLIAVAVKGNAKYTKQKTTNKKKKPQRNSIKSTCLFVHYKNEHDK